MNTMEWLREVIELEGGLGKADPILLKLLQDLWDYYR